MRGVGIARNKGSLRARSGFEGVELALTKWKNGGDVGLAWTQNKIPWAF